jgi:membrane associated rhomboid family serine protease
MFLILPMRSDALLRRWPVCTMALIAVSLAVWAMTLVREREVQQRLPPLAEEAATLLSEHPELEPDVELGYLLATHKRAAWRVTHPSRGVAPGRGVAEARQRLAELSAQSEAVRGTDLRWRLAYGRQNEGAVRLVMSQFTHSSWGHLLGNAWFLWVLGIALEDRLGRLVHLGLYLAGGATAGYLHRLASPVPGIGASGAIAAVMGAFAVLLPTTRIQVRVAALVPVPVSVSGRFGSIVRLTPLPLGLAWLRLPTPAWLVLFSWGGLELWRAATVTGSGIAHWAHAGGFGFGVVVAVVLRLSGWDSRLDRAVEDAGAQQQGPRLLEASAMIDQGKPGVAIVRLRALLANPAYSPIDVHLELLRAALAAGSRRDELASRAALLELYLDSDGPTRELLEETRSRGLAGELPAHLLRRLEGGPAKVG